MQDTQPFAGTIQFPYPTTASTNQLITTEAHMYREVCAAPPKTPDEFGPGMLVGIGGTLALLALVLFLMRASAFLARVRAVVTAFEATDAE